MQEVLEPVPGGRFSFATNFVVILGAFCLVTLAAWPILMSFDLWIFKDRSSFLNLDYLAFTRHARIGVDICYSYGLLPVLLQHLALAPFGQGYRPMIACTFLVMLLNALFWALLLQHLTPQRRWLLTIVALTPIIYNVNPNWPYSLALLSILFALLFVLKERLNLAFTVAVIGCFCVPSLPLVLTGMLALVIVFNWWQDPNRSFGRLVAVFAPGVATYMAMALCLVLVFGSSSFAATALPLAGARYYHAQGYDKATAILAFLLPAGYSVKYYLAYYLFSSVTWFFLCALLLFTLSVSILVRALRGKALTPAGTFIVIFSVMLFLFMFFAYGPRGQHELYDGVLAAAVFVAISSISSSQRRSLALQVFLCTGLLAGTSVAYKAIASWRTTAPGPNTLGLYASAGVADQWSQVLQLSKEHRVLLLGYATGQHIYYPTLATPDAWILAPGLVLPTQEDAILDQIEHAQIVVEDDTSPSPVIDDKMQVELAKLHEVHTDGRFRVLQRGPMR